MKESLRSEISKRVAAENESNNSSKTSMKAQFLRFTRHQS
jgi:hypothetical protein